jgi:Putative beta-barrel porin 2
MPHIRAHHVLLAACLTAPLPAAAQSSAGADGSRPWYVTLSQEVEHQTNALSSTDGEFSDTLWTTSLGGGLNLRFGRQRAYATARLSHNRYSKLDGLDGQSYDLGAGLDWQTVGNLSGNLQANAGRRQADFNTGITTVTLKNTERFEELRARALLGGVGLLGIEGTLGMRRVDFSAPEFASREYVQTSASAGVLYRPSSALSLGAGLQGQVSDYDVPAFGQSQPDSNKRRDVYLTADWQATGASTLGGRANIGKTDYDRPNADDFSGLTGSVYWNWRPTGRTAVTTTLSRETGQESGFQRLTSGERTRLTATDFSRVTNLLSVAANYELTGKIFLTGQLTYANRKLVDSLTNGTGKDNTTTASLGARWQATRIITVGCTIGHEMRSASGVGSFDYSGSTVGCLGQVTLD